jgi:hypothetical protein
MPRLAATTAKGRKHTAEAGHWSPHDPTRTKYRDATPQTLTARRPGHLEDLHPRQPQPVNVIRHWPGPAYRGVRTSVHATSDVDTTAVGRMFPDPWRDRRVRARPDVRAHDGRPGRRPNSRPHRRAETQAHPAPGPHCPADVRRNDPDGKRRYTVAQIAAEFGVTRPTIYRHLEREGLVPPS